MEMTRREQTILPQTSYARRFANEYCEKLKRQNAFVDRKDSAVDIVIEAQYHFNISEEEDK